MKYFGYELSHVHLHFNYKISIVYENNFQLYEQQIVNAQVILLIIIYKNYFY